MDMSRMNTHIIKLVLCERHDVFGRVVDVAPEIMFNGSYSQAHQAIMRVAAYYNSGKTDYFFAIVARLMPKGGG